MSIFLHCLVYLLPLDTHKQLPYLGGQKWRLEAMRLCTYILCIYVCVGTYYRPQLSSCPALYFSIVFFNVVYA